MTEAIAIRFLGPTVGIIEGSPVDLGPPRQQATLAVLASHVGRAVSKAQLIDALWGEAPPASAEQSVYTYVAGLRRALEPRRGPRERPQIVTSTAGGYLLRLRPEQIDVWMLAHLLEKASQLKEPGNQLQRLALLNEALDLWRGPSLCGVPGPWAERERMRLEELRFEAVETRADLLIALRRHEEAIESLQELTARSPLRERPRELLMLALFHSDRQAEALAIYEEGRRVLADELGVSPGEGLRRSHEIVLRGPTPSPSREPSIPRQLPRELLGFVGRAAETAKLKGLLVPWDRSPAHPLVVISGPPGIGKSTLAVQVAHLVRDSFPDGQLHLDLRGATPNVPRLGPLDVLGRLLRALGVPGAAVPDDVDEAAAVWRGCIDGKRLLVLLDDAAELAQIRPVLSVPSGSAILVTSRESMRAADDCYQIHLSCLTAAEASTVLAKLVGAERIASDPQGTRRLVEYCDGLPLAIKIVGARLADQPDWGITAFAERFRDERQRLHELEAGDITVRSSFMASLDALRSSPRPIDRSAARVLAQLGILHVPTITADAVAQLAAMDEGEAARSLDRLVNANLLERREQGRYRLHDLVRLFVGELRPEGRHEAMSRVLSYYVATARRASTLMDPHRVQPQELPVDARPRRLSDQDEAVSWLADEEANLTQAALQAMAGEDADLAKLGTALAFALMWYQQKAHHAAEMVTLNSAALEVGIRLDDQRITRFAHSHVAGGLHMHGRPAEAGEHFGIELAMAREAGDVATEHRALGNLANVHLTMEDYGRALHYAQQQLALAKKISSRIGERYAQLIAGAAHTGLRQFEEARVSLEASLRNARADGDIVHEGQAHMHLGEALLAAGRGDVALEHLRQGAAKQQAGGYKIGELRCLVGVSKALRIRGQLTEALETISGAMPLARALGNERWKLRAELEQEAVHAALGVPPVRAV
ncbi:AfsR/SARP family transcriptional regulator [Nonomuraea sediminis]|uniref:AfsR/SARP family transcriptional regulator n=1 Tax=Nonomuraea sediminis TaxID=2835864 RepID=UPI001BDC7150|nr:BTAD domain-containing putative transcriptional regulator [Nonomuraea sediminis]